MTGLTAEQTADGVGQQLWVTEALVEVVGAWDRPAADDDGAALRVWAARARRLFDQHLEAWRTQLPESVLLEPDGRVQPTDDHRVAVDAARDAVDPAERARATATALDAVHSSLTGLAGRAGPVSDGSLLRVSDTVARDLLGLRRALPLIDPAV
ncbi:MAG: hypothetical protein ACR2QE_07525 [Acidimicrobiales bacterium]